MSNRTKKAKSGQPGADKNAPHITKITASSSRERSNQPASETPPAKSSELAKEGIKPELVVSDTGKTDIKPLDKSDAELNKSKKLTRAEKKAARLAHQQDEERPLKTYFILFRPFVALGRYLRDSWREIRLVRWPNRKATWKMTAAVLVYCAIFMIFLTLLDVFFTFIFDLIFK